MPSAVEGSWYVERRCRQFSQFLPKYLRRSATVAVMPPNGALLRHRVGRLPWHCGRVRAVVQRVLSAHVDSTVDQVTRRVGSIGAGLCVLVGVTHDDDAATADRMADRIAGLRLMADDDGVMNRSVRDVGAEVLVVSQFTLYGDTSRGRRPSWTAAARPEQAEPLVDAVVDGLRQRGVVVATGAFRTDMAVTLVNDGPATVILDV